MPKILKKKKCDNPLSKRPAKYTLPINGRRKKIKNITIGCEVFERYECAKRNLCYRNDDDFINYLLGFVENQTRYVVIINKCIGIFIVLLLINRYMRF